MLIFLYLHHSRYAKMKIVSACWRSSSSSSSVAYINKNDERLELGIKSTLALYTYTEEEAPPLWTGESNSDRRRPRESERSKGYIYTWYTRCCVQANGRDTQFTRRSLRYRGQNAIRRGILLLLQILFYNIPSFPCIACVYIHRGFFLSSFFALYTAMLLLRVTYRRQGENVGLFYMEELEDIRR